MPGATGKRDPARPARPRRRGAGVAGHRELPPQPAHGVGAVAEAALAEVVRTAGDDRTCVERQIGPWQPPSEVRRRDPPPPPGFERLYVAGVFRGGGGLKGAAAGGATVRSGPGCYDVRGPLIDGELAMMDIHLAHDGFNLWMRRTAGDWRVVMTTSSDYVSRRT